MPISCIQALAGLDSPPSVACSVFYLTGAVTYVAICHGNPMYREGTRRFLLNQSSRAHRYLEPIGTPAKPTKSHQNLRRTRGLCPLKDTGLSIPSQLFQRPPQHLLPTTVRAELGGSPLACLAPLPGVQPSSSAGFLGSYRENQLRDPS